MPRRVENSSFQNVSAPSSKSPPSLLRSAPEGRLGMFLWQTLRAAILLIVLSFSSLVARSADLDNKDRHAQHEFERLEQTLRSTTSEADRAIIENQIAEVRSAIENNHRPSIPTYVDFAEFPIRLADALNNRIGNSAKST